MSKRFFLLLLIILLSFSSMAMSFFKLNRIYEYVLFFSMALLLIHMWYGAYVFLKYMKLSTLIIFLGFLIVLPVISIGFLIKNMLFLFISLFFLLSLANILYRTLAKHESSRRLRNYAAKKAKIEAPAIPLILISVIILYYFPSEAIKLFFSVISIPAHLFYVYIMFVKEKLYNL